MNHGRGERTKLGSRRRSEGVYINERTERGEREREGKKMGF